MSAYGRIHPQTVALVVNPQAGHGVSQEAARLATQELTRLGIDVVSLQGSSATESQRLVREAVADDRVDAVAVAGGDGMVNLALQELAHQNKPLGIIPAGTGNDHGREYQLPRHSPVEAARIIAQGHCRRTDLGLITDQAGQQHWFGTIMCAGFDSIVSDRVNAMTWPHGRNRYNLAIVVEFLKFHSLPFHLRFEGVHDSSEAVELADDGSLELDLPITLAAFGNTRSYGGGMKICPEADHADGLLDVTVIGKATRWQAATTFQKVFSGTHTEHPSVSTYRVQKAHVACLSERTMNAYADGDFMAALPVTVEVSPGAGCYLVPEPV